MRWLTLVRYEAEANRARAKRDSARWAERRGEAENNPRIGQSDFPSNRHATKSVKIGQNGAYERRTV